MILDWLSENEAWLRWYVLLLGFISVGVLENLRPRRELRSSAPVRWLLHFAMAICTNVIGTVTIGLATVALAVAAQTNPYGLLNHEFLPFGVQFVAGILLVDLFAYGLHRVYHAVPWMWRIHEAHHSDPDFDQTTGLRFHPLESLIGAVTGAIVIYVIALPPSAMAFRQLSFIFITFFSHSNVHLPERLDAFLRRFLVTPDMHRIHHSDRIEEQQRNYGGYIPLWDHLFGTYQHSPALGHEEMQVGSAEIPERECLSFYQILIRPFRSSASRASSQAAASPQGD